MRSLLTALVLVSACTSSGMSVGDDDDGSGSGSGSDMLMPPVRGFQIVTPEKTLGPNEENTFCYYFKTSNTEPYTIKRWESLMTDGSHHMILYFMSTLKKPEGTFDDQPCGLGGGGTTISSLPAWIYSAQTPSASLALPTDDGAGNPLGMDVPAGQAAVLQLHYLNKTDEPITVKGTINAEAYDAGVTTTKTAAYVTYNSNIHVDPMMTGEATLDCPIPSGKKVWLMSTHAHRHATATEVRDGTHVVVHSDDWEHPNVARTDSPFYTFASGKVTSDCNYYNGTSVSVDEGDSAQTDEMCMASGYAFPANKVMFCYDGYLLP